MSLALDKNNKNDDGLDIPDFLRIPQEDRRKAWEQYKPTQTASSANPERRYSSETQDQYEKRLALEHPQHHPARVDGPYWTILKQAVAASEKEPFTDKRYLLGFNFVDYLKGLGRIKNTRGGFIGQIYPWKKDDPRPPVFALLVPLKNALDEYTHWSGQDITIDQFKKYLNDNNIFLGSEINEFVKFKKAYETKHTGIDIERKVYSMTPNMEKLVNRFDVSKDKVKYKRDIGCNVIAGKHGYIIDDPIDPDKSHVVITDTDKWSSTKKKLTKFMRLIENEEQTGGKFTLKGEPTSEQTTAVRKAVGLKKRPDLTDDQRAVLRQRFYAKDNATEGQPQHI